MMNKDIIGLHTKKKRFAFNNTLTFIRFNPGHNIQERRAVYMNLIQRNSNPKEE
jgi:hypothetical protein